MNLSLRIHQFLLLFQVLSPSDTPAQDGNVGTAAHLVSKSGGLSSGTIAVIIISIIAAIAAVVVVLKRRGAFSSKRRISEYDASASELKIN